MVNTIELLERLISFPTVSCRSNLGLIEFVRDFLAERGIASTIICGPASDKANLFATVGPADKQGIMLSGHTDVVPVDGQAWSTSPFGLVERDGRLIGRGTADMKGFVACALRAADIAASKSLKTPLHLALSHDEEVGCIGVRSLIDWLKSAPVKPRFGIVGEPTAMHVALGHKGKTAIRAHCQGTGGHSALSTCALNAIHLACDLIGVLREHQNWFATEARRDLAYDVPYTTVHVGIVSGGTALNIVPSRATVDFEVRTLPDDDVPALLASIASAAARIEAREAKRFPDAQIRLENLSSYPGLDISPDSEIVGLVRSLLESKTTTKLAFGTEAGLFAAELPIPTVVCGPGSMEQGHKPDEFITRDQLSVCDRMMDRLIAHLVSQ